MIYPHGLPAIIATYGNPFLYLEDKRAWEDMILATRPLPKPLPYAYGPGTVSTIRAHHLVVDVLVEMLTKVLEAGCPLDRLTYGGCYAWRSMRTANKLSTHTWGIAIDLDPARNALGAKHDPFRGLPMLVVDVFEGYGWTWGGRWKKTDPMHLQAAAGY